MKGIILDSDKFATKKHEDMNHIIEGRKKEKNI